MKKLFTLGLILSSATAFADGNLARQSNAAVAAAVVALEQTHRAELREFKSVYAELIGHETFAVTVTFANQAQLNYVCGENEAVQPVVWNCTQK